MFAVPLGAAGEKFSKFDTFSCVFKAKNDKFYVFSLNFKNLNFYVKKKNEWCLRCRGAAGEKFSKFNTFLCIFKSIFPFSNE